MPRFAFARFSFSKFSFGTARSRQGRAVLARRSEPLTARTVLEHGAEGKAGGDFKGCPFGGDPGQRPEHLTARVVSARHPALPAFHAATPLLCLAHALRLFRKLANSFRLAPCMEIAACVSVFAPACRSNRWMVIPGLRRRATSGN